MEIINTKMNKEQLIIYQKKLVELMKVFIEFCDEYNLIYYACGGTAIGTVRHKGFIPWDDDIDVYMLREDYDRFLSLGPKLKGTKYEILSLEDSEDYYQVFAKFIDTSTTVWENKQYPSVTGVWIDIFPLDRVNKDFKNNKLLICRYYWAINCYRRANNKHSWASFKEDFQKQGWLVIPLLLFDFYARFINRFFGSYRKDLLRLLKRIKQQKGDYFFCYGIRTMNKNKIFPKSYFASYREMPFEDIQMKVQVEVENALNQEFGDYMQLPPEEERVSLHGSYYINLNERKTVEEIKDLMNKKL